MHTMVSTFGLTTPVTDATTAVESRIASPPLRRLSHVPPAPPNAAELFDTDEHVVMHREDRHDDFDEDDPATAQQDYEPYTSDNGEDLRLPSCNELRAMY